MGDWKTIDNDTSRFRLLCDHESCQSSICNMIKGKLHITTIHSNNRHSTYLEDSDMLFIISQYLSNLSKEDRTKFLKFVDSF